MAAYAEIRSKTATLDTTTVDTVTLGQPWDRIEVANHDTVEPLYVTFDGTTPTAAGDDCSYIGPGQSIVVKAPQLNSELGTTIWHKVSVIGSGNVYTVEGLAGQ
jgi:hypothetical protein